MIACRLTIKGMAYMTEKTRNQKAVSSRACVIGLDENGDAIIQFSDEFCVLAGLQIGDEFEIEIQSGQIILSKIKS